MRLLALLALLVASLGSPAPAGAADLPQTVRFPSKDGTDLVGFLFRPSSTASARSPAVVMLHGRGGPYSILAKGVYDASTLTKRHASWGHYWAEHGYVALLVDSFSTRGFPKGFAKGSYAERPEAVNEVTVRPLDAYGALAYLKAQAFVDPGRIALMGWSNGGSATLASMADATLSSLGLKPADGFSGAVAFYAGCGMHERFKERYKPYAPVRLFSGLEDDEVEPRLCEELVEKARAQGADIAITTYPDATHDFDDPGAKRSSVPANAAAAKDAIARTTAFIGGLGAR